MSAHDDDIAGRPLVTLPDGTVIFAAVPGAIDRHFRKPDTWAVWLEEPGPLRWVRVWGTLVDAFDRGADHFGVDVDAVCVLDIADFYLQGPARPDPEDDINCAPPYAGEE